VKLRLKEGVPEHKGRALHPLMKFAHYYRPNFHARYQIGHKGLEIPDGHAKGLLLAHSDILEVAPKDESVQYKRWTAKISRMKRQDMFKLAGKLKIDNFANMKNDILRKALLKDFDKLEEAYQEAFGEK
jgi:hypothetical protein